MRQVYLYSSRRKRGERWLISVMRCSFLQSDAFWTVFFTYCVTHLSRSFARSERHQYPRMSEQRPGSCIVSTRVPTTRACPRLITPGNQPYEVLEKWIIQETTTSVKSVKKTFFIETIIGQKMIAPNFFFEVLVYDLREDMLHSTVLVYNRV